MVFDHVCGARNCSARCRFAQFRPLLPRFGRFSRHRRRSLTRLSCRSPALGQIFLCQIKMHPYGVHFYLAEKERFGLRPRLRCPKLLCSLPLRAISTAAPSFRSLLPPPAALPHSSLLPVPGARSNLSLPNEKAPLWVLFHLAEKERFELSRRLSRPTPLAGAPLRPLEYFSKGCQRSSQN